MKYATQTKVERIELEMSRVCVGRRSVVSRNAPTHQFVQPTVEIWLFEQTSKLFKCNCCAEIDLLGRYKNAAATT